MQAYGYDVLEVEPNTDVARKAGYSRLGIVFDNRTGKVSVSDRAGAPLVKATGFDWLMEGRAEIQIYRDFLAARQGACGAFFVPTWQHDLALSGDVPAGLVGIRIQNVGYTKFQFPNQARRYLCFILLDGSGRKIYRKVTAAGEDGATEVLTLDVAPGAIAAAFCMISFLTFVRLATDEPELTWHSTDVAEATLDFTELPLEIPQ